MKKILSTTIAVMIFCAVVAYAATQTESDKIEYLISSVENLDEAKFIRNGSEHSSKDAASHLRMKLQKAGKRVRTADDFIRLIASKSYLSGEPYRIRFANGKTVPAEDYFRNALKKYDGHKIMK